ncbi:hypothetical protein V7S43_013590 [Phytophthora oleae]|uniref:Uncharacterized protein n=1 Tax=Phytophthora oleae TaxID=2107226 RepID=A0ABD3F5W3_9STRA
MRYFNMAESVREMLFEDEVEPDYWGPMVEGEDVIMEDLGPDELVEQKYDKSKDGDFNPEDEDGDDPNDDDEEFPPATPPHSHSGSRHLSPSGYSSSTSSSRQKPRRMDATTTALARKNYGSLTQLEKLIIKIPSPRDASWRHNGVRLKWGDPMGGNVKQTPGLPDYAPNRNDIGLLKVRTTTMDSQIRQLLNGAPWNDMYARRPQ